MEGNSTGKFEKHNEHYYMPLNLRSQALNITQHNHDKYSFFMVILYYGKKSDESNLHSLHLEIPTGVDV